MNIDFGGLLRGTCPICGSLADVSPQSEFGLAVHCNRCGEFDLSDAAEEVLQAYEGTLDREKLSEVMVEMRMMAECERPLIDSIAASTLIAFATM